MIQPTPLTEQPYQPTAGCIQIRLPARSQRIKQFGICLTPVVQPGLEFAVTLIQERPVKISRIRHQLPSNFGLSLATKAR